MNRKPRLLFLTHRVPFPPNRGDRIRALHELRSLATQFDVTLATVARSRADRRAAKSLEADCEQVILVDDYHPRSWARVAARVSAGRSVTEAFFAKTEVGERALEQSRIRPFEVAFGYGASTVRQLVRIPAERHLIDLVDVDSLKWSTFAAKARGPMRWICRREARAVRSLEDYAANQCDAVIFATEPEARLSGLNPAPVRVVQNGVDVDYFAPISAPPSPASIAFTGTMSYAPNSEAVCWFAQEVWPAILRRWPRAKFCIIGRSPTWRVRNLARLPGIRVTGELSDVRPELGASQIAVAPLQTARGVQNKVLEAMAMGKAMIASRAALAGLDLKIDQEVLEANTPDEWCNHIVSLLQNAAWRRNLGENARRAAVDRYLWKDRLEDLLEVVHEPGVSYARRS